MADRPHTLYESVLRLTRAVRAAFELRVKETQGLTFARARLLAMIGHNEGASQTELAVALGIETPTLKRQLDALEAQGLAERRPMPDDARKYAVFLTDAARIEPLLGFRAEIEAVLTEGVAAEDIATTRRVLDRMAEKIEKLKAR
ncbi:MarR family transcriptional regulator [Paracoccus aurantiacus]|uniref:MarR family transcriptional regulator n=1 Tax=Paracoccus aurantiacus TaxID=2599412 RepID=A0A5C6S4U4_9RHOB|nr:MarR family transcriptional regulator [Paracoccus aurantiacus]TXB69267.1 MarR family transcriptional regulator [Paracoccus aurantiacus]